METNWQTLNQARHDVFVSILLNENTKSDLAIGKFSKKIIIKSFEYHLNLIYEYKIGEETTIKILGNKHKFAFFMRNCS